MREFLHQYILHSTERVYLDTIFSPQDSLSSGCPKLVLIILLYS